MLKSKWSIFINALLLFISISFCAFQCNKEIACNNPMELPAKLDSMSVGFINKEITDINLIEFKTNNLMLSISAFISPKDSFIQGFCNVFVLRDTIQEIAIYTVNNINASYSANADVTNLFRAVNYDFSMQKPYYQTISQWLKEHSSTSNARFLLAENIEINNPIPFKLRVVYTYANKVQEFVSREVNLIP